jgi:hypothetical protein
MSVTFKGLAFWGMDPVARCSSGRGGNFPVRHSSSAPVAYHACMSNRVGRRCQGRSQKPNPDDLMGMSGIEPSTYHTIRECPTM